MHRTRVKICGIGRVEDALEAARAGADAIGLAQYPKARRFVPPERARQIVAALPPFVSPVAIFVDDETRVILDRAEELRIRHVQLHGRETPEQVAELRGLSVIKAVHVTRETLADELNRWRRAIAELRLAHVVGLLLETGNTGQAGGTGIENDWAAIRDAQRAGLLKGLPPVILAGGLRPDNVADVVRDLQPWAVDVSSGVENVPGQKSPDKIAAFVQAVRNA